MLRRGVPNGVAAMLRLAADTEQFAAAQERTDVIQRVPGERSEVCQDWTLQLLPLQRALRLAGHLMTQAFAAVPLQARLLCGSLRSQ